VTPSGNGRGRNGNGTNGNGVGTRVAANRRRRQRRRRDRGLGKKLGLLGVLALFAAVVGGVGAAALGGAAAFTGSCDLNSLQPVAIGQNSFVYAADGSLLGVIPA
jgi:hypothetical protein